jgi:hypothetical protein
MVEVTIGVLVVSAAVSPPVVSVLSVVVVSVVVVVVSLVPPPQATIPSTITRARTSAMMDLILDIDFILSYFGILTVIDADPFFVFLPVSTNVSRIRLTTFILHCEHQKEKDKLACLELNLQGEIMQNVQKLAHSIQSKMGLIEQYIKNRRPEGRRQVF